MMKLKLNYSNLDQPGYGRRRRGRGFSYLHPNGQIVRNNQILEYCRKLIIPPAWSYVWISRDTQGHILCTGLDGKGRKQYVYHPFWTESQKLRKFDDIVDFASSLGSIRQSVTEDLAGNQLTKRRVIATAIGLLDSGLIRVGNEAYTKDNGTFGATTLRTQHASVDSKVVVLKFKGKSGKQRHVQIDDADLARSIKLCRELPGQNLFQYRSSNGKLTTVTSTQINSYLKKAAAADITAKNFRTWGGTVAAYEYAYAHRRDSHGKPDVQAVKYAAQVLGNTPTVAKQSYVHPEVLDSIKNSTLPKRTRYTRKGLSVSESTVLRFLESL